MQWHLLLLMLVGLLAPAALTLAHKLAPTLKPATATPTVAVVGCTTATYWIGDAFHCGAPPYFYFELYSYTFSLYDEVPCANIDSVYVAVTCAGEAYLVYTSAAIPVCFNSYHANAISPCSWADSQVYVEASGNFYYVTTQRGWHLMQNANGSVVLSSLQDASGLTDVSVHEQPFGFYSYFGQCSAAQAQSHCVFDFLPGNGFQFQLPKISFLQDAVYYDHALGNFATTQPTQSLYMQRVCNSTARYYIMDGTSGQTYDIVTGSFVSANDLNKWVSLKRVPHSLYLNQCAFSVRCGSMD